MIIYRFIEYIFLSTDLKTIVQMLPRTILLSLLIISISADNSLNVRENSRTKRQIDFVPITFPSGNNLKVIVGLGVPVDLNDASVTIGSVFKFNYDLPSNSTIFTNRIFGFANDVSRDMDVDIADVADKSTEEQSSREISETDDQVDNALVDITFDDRRKRAILNAEGSINAIDSSDHNPALPLEEAIRRQEEIDKMNAEKNVEESGKINRWDLYKIFENMVERYGYTGRPCMLRTICEAAEVPFTHENGLLAEIAHILFTPSTTKDKLSHHTDNEYHAAERLGREAGIDCETLFSECEGSILETFTQIGEHTLHKFGFI